MDNVTVTDLDDYLYPPVARQYQTVNRILLIFSSALFGLGTVLNLWFVISVLSSQHCRLRFRNQLICNLSICHLAVTLVKSPVMVFYAKLLLRDFQWYNLCDSLTLAVRLTVVSNFIQDCLLFFIATAYLFSVAGIDPSKCLGPGAVTAGKLVIHMLPWMASPALMPLLSRLLPHSSWCLSPLSNEIQQGLLFIIAVPVLACFLIASVAFALSRCRFPSSRNSISPAMPSRRSQRRGYVDNPLVYVSAALVGLACEAAFVVFLFIIATQDLSIKMTFVSGACGVADSRAVLMLLPWLLLPDIRDRLKAWRLWQRSSRQRPGPDTQRENLALETGE